MEFKHFSHSHGLVHHQLPAGVDIQCSGCRSTGSGTVYTCWQCSFFLHEQCFRATRSLKHPSHPLHPLTLVPYPTYPSNSFYCNVCNQIGSGFSYCCSECEFDLHVHCALLPSNTNLAHESYPQVQPQVPNLATPHESYPQIPYPNYPNFPSNATQIFQPLSPQVPQIVSTPYPSQTCPVQNYPPQSYSISGSATASTSSVPLSTTNTSTPQMPTPTPPPAPVPMSAPVSTPTPVPVPVPAAPAQVVESNFPQIGKFQPKMKEIKHFSHPHTLRQSEISEKDGKVCSGCEDDLTGSAYICTESQCKFSLHEKCFELPREIKHKSHLDHPLTLLGAPTYDGGQFTCNACLRDGTGFVYNCSTCTFDLHSDCVSWPEFVERSDHKHTLTLYYSSPIPKPEEEQEVTFVCDVCRKSVHQMAWIYYCRECDFGTHLECIASPVSQPPEKSQEQLVQEAELKMAVLQLLLSGCDPSGLVKS